MSRRHTPQLILTILLAALCILPTFSVRGQNSSQIEAQKQVIARLEEQIARQERELTRLKKGRAQSEERVRQLARQIDSRNQLLEAQERQAELLGAQLTRTNATADSLSRALEHHRALYGAMVREAYRNYRHENYLTYLFSAEDFADIARKIANLRAVSHMRAEKLRTIAQLKEEVTTEKELLDRRKRELDSVTSQLRAQRSKLERDARNARSEVQRLTKQERQRLQQKVAQEQQLDVAIETLRKLSRGNREGDSFSSKTTGLRLPVASGRVRRYKENMAEITGPKGARVTSIYDGKVVEIKRNRITNKYDVYIAHGEYLTSYANLGTVSVQKEQKVSRNQQIGTIGSSVNIHTMETEYKLVFGIYSPSPTEKMRAEKCFRP